MLDQEAKDMVAELGDPEHQKLTAGSDFNLFICCQKSVTVIKR